MISAWDQMVPKMSLGEKAIITGTPDVCYGEVG